MSKNPTTIGIGLISVGWMGQLHSRAYTNVPVVYPELGIRTRLIIAADTNEERARFAQDVLGYESSTADYHDVLNHPDVDVVSVCAPNFLHEEIGRAVAEAGKSLWIEKPVGRSAEETESVVNAADAAEVVTAVGFNYRNAPAIEYARQLVADGSLGRITNVRGAFFADYSAEPNGALSWRICWDTSPISPTTSSDPSTRSPAWPTPPTPNAPSSRWAAALTSTSSKAARWPRSRTRTTPVCSSTSARTRRAQARSEPSRHHGCAWDRAQSTHSRSTEPKDR